MIKKLGWINDESHGTYNVSNQIKLKTLMIRSILCDYSDAYIHVKEPIKILNMASASAATNNANKKVIFKTFSPFTNCRIEINNIQVDEFLHNTRNFLAIL